MQKLQQNRPMAEASDSVEEARQIVLARLAAAEAERKAAAAERKEVATALSDPGESISKYLAEFSSTLARLHGSLEALLSTQPEASSRDLKSVQEQLDALTAEAFQVWKVESLPCFHTSLDPRCSLRSDSRKPL